VVAAKPGESGVHVARLTAADVHRYRALMLHAYEAAADAFTSGETLVGTVIGGVLRSPLPW
jgi:hypothetical protein